MESLQTLSARVLAKNDFKENFFPQKAICHQEIKKQKILDLFNNYKNFCLEIEDLLNVVRNNLSKYYESAVPSAFHKNISLKKLKIF